MPLRLIMNVEYVKQSSQEVKKFCANEIVSSDKKTEKGHDVVALAAVFPDEADHTILLAYSWDRLNTLIQLAEKLPEWGACPLALFYQHTLSHGPMDPLSLSILKLGFEQIV